ncbi:MAG: glycosyltransferase family 39 protein [Bacteroidales bacterium]|nr:glycosyltransferase family 39 protein [Bacteroidales bacterium]
MNIRSNLSNLQLQFLIAISAAVLFIPFIGGVHLFDWDEINFAECAREMIVSHDYLNVQINFLPFWEKPPLFIWMQVLSMKVFGVNEFAARFPNAVIGIISLLFIFNIGRKLFDSRFGLGWVVVYAGSILPHFYFRSGIIDPLFNLLIFAAIWFFIKLHLAGEIISAKRRFGFSSLWGVFTGLAILTKGPTALLIIGLVVAIAYLPDLLRLLKIKSRFLTSIPAFTLRFSDILVFFLFTILVGGSWFLLQVLNGNADMVMKFILYQVRLFTIPDAGHGGPWFYHFVVLLAGVFPASLFALMRFRRAKDQPAAQRQFHGLMLILFWVVLILFSIVKTKIVHYSSLCYFPLTFFAAVAIRDLLNGSLKWRKWLSALLVVFASVFAIAVSVLPLIDQFKEKIIDSGIIKDDFAVANLQADVEWTGLEWVLGLILISAVIYSVILAHRQSISKALKVLFAGSVLFIAGAILVFPYRIEKYSQRAVIDFYISKSTEKCYVLNSGYFSYAPLFYTKKMPDDCARPMWLLTGNIDRPFYLVLKEPHYNEWKHLIPAMEVLYKKNGFVFLARYPVKKNE